MNGDKTNIKEVNNPVQVRNLDFQSKLKLDQTDFNLSTKVRSLSIVLNGNFTLKYQSAVVRIIATGCFISIDNISIFIDQQFKLKLVKCLVHTQKVFCISLF